MPPPSSSPPSQSTPPPSTQDLLADRYGAPDARSRRTAYVVIAVVALLGLAWLAWAGLRPSGGGVSGTVTRFSVVSPTLMRADVSVTGPADRAVSCDVQVLDTDGSVVGRTKVRVPPASGAGSATRAVPAQIRVVSPGDSVQVVACTAVQ